MIFEHLNEFHQRLYGQMGKAKAALFDLMDAVLVSGSIPSFVSLFQSPVFRRRWPSIYAALQDSTLSGTQVMKQVRPHFKPSAQPLLAGDHTQWSRPDAPTLKDRALG
jgi:hypothetical protein